MNYVRTHRFDAPQDALPRPLAQATIAQAERQFHSALYLRAQVGRHYAIYRGRA